MCVGGKLLADFQAGTIDPLDLPDVVAACLVPTVDDGWVVWAHKVARPRGAKFAPLSASGTYPADARARCMYLPHDAPRPNCTCGFHALSAPMFPGGWLRGSLVQLEVALSGRILAFEWQGSGVLFRAERQTVLRIERKMVAPPRRPDDSAGRLVRILRQSPQGTGPLRLRLPEEPAPFVVVNDDVGACWEATIDRETAGYQRHSQADRSGRSTKVAAVASAQEEP
jgi:hypothetical protein